MSRTRPLHRGGALAVGAVMATSVIAFAQVNSATPVTVTVNAAAPLATVPGTALGVNTAVWDGQLLDPSVPALLRRKMREPNPSLPSMAVREQRRKLPLGSSMPT